MTTFERIITEYPLVQWSATITSSISTLNQGKIIDCEDKTRHMPGAQCSPQNSLCFWTKVNEMTQSPCYTKAKVSEDGATFVQHALCIPVKTSSFSTRVQVRLICTAGDAAESDLMHYSLFSQPPEQPVNKLRSSVSSSFITSLKIIFPCNQKRMK